MKVSSVKGKSIESGIRVYSAKARDRSMEVSYGK